MQRLIVKGSHTGHTLVGAALDCHPNVVMNNVYGRTRTPEEVCEDRGSHQWGLGETYQFEHPSQNRNKRPLWIGSTSDLEGPIDLQLNVVRNPYVVARSVSAKYDDPLGRLGYIFDQMSDGPIIYYEDLVAEPKMQFMSIAALLNITAHAEWIEDAVSLVVRVEQPQIQIDLSSLFAKHQWLRRYRQ